jgi:hypothetical protein
LKKKKKKKIGDFFCEIFYEFAERNLRVVTISILLQGPVYCFWRADFHAQGDIVGREYIKLSGVTSVAPAVHENQLSNSNKLDAEAIWLYTCDAWGY